jgi:hypothetical protein
MSWDVSDTDNELAPEYAGSLVPRADHLRAPAHRPMISIFESLCAFVRASIHQPAVRAIGSLFASARQEAEPNVRKLVDTVLGPQPRRVMGNSAESLHLDMYPEQLRSLLIDLAATVHYAHISTIASLVSGLLNEIAENRLDPIADFRFWMADETSMMATNDDNESASDTSDDHTLIGTSKPVAVLDKDIENEMTKFTQGRAILAFLLKCRATDEFIFYIIPVSVLVRTADSGISEVYAQIFKEYFDIPLVDDIRKLCRNSFDLTCLDRASSNKKDLNARLHASETHAFSHDCQAHIVHQIQEVALQPFHSDTSGIISFGVIQRNAGAVRKLRKELAHVLKCRVVIVRIQPEPTAANDEILSRLLPTHSAGRRRHARLRYLLFGDLFGNRVVWNTLIPGASKSRWARDVAKLMLPRRTPIFQVQRWVNNLEPLQGGAILQIYNLFRLVVPRWTARLSNKEPPPLTEWNDPDTETEEFDMSVLRQGVPRLPDGGPDWAAWTQRHRVSTKVYASTSPSLTSVLSILLMKPQVQLLHHVEKHASLGYSDTLFKSWADAADETPPLRMVEAASQSFSYKHLESVRGLMHASDQYEILPLRVRTQAQATLAYASLSRAACACIQLLHDPCSRFPTCLWLVFLGDYAQGIAKLCERKPCEWEQFTRKLFGRFPLRAKILSWEFRLILLCIAMLMVSSRLLPHMFLYKPRYCSKIGPIPLSSILYDVHVFIVHERRVSIL